MIAVILSIGDELVLGQTVDTNSAWMSRELAAVGFSVAAHMTVADDQAAIELAIADWSTRADALIISGEIGPTEDDLTRQALAGVLGVPLEMDQGWINRLENFWARRGIPMPAINRIQAGIPRGAKLLDNPNGTAAGIRATVNKCDVFVMPGVPKEMKAMFTQLVMPVLKQHGGGAAIVSSTLHTFGLGESAIAEKLGDLMNRRRNPSVGTTVANGIVSLRVNSRFESVEHASAEIETTSVACREKLGDLIFGQDDETLWAVVARMLIQAKATVATAESCTGGLLSRMLTDIPGSSAYFLAGWVVYSNDAKMRDLGVSAATLEQSGAVSEATVRELAANARSRAGTTYAMAISGIAGPDGGTASKPVGTVCIALADPVGVAARTFLLPGDREWVRDRSAKMALTMLRFKLLGKEMPF